MMGNTDDWQLNCQYLCWEAYDSYPFTFQLQHICGSVLKKERSIGLHHMQYCGQRCNRVEWRHCIFDHNDKTCHLSFYYDFSQLHDFGYCWNLDVLPLYLTRLQKSHLKCHVVSRGITSVCKFYGWSLMARLSNAYSRSPKHSDLLQRSICIN